MRHVGRDDPGVEVLAGDVTGGDGGLAHRRIGLHRDHLVAEGGSAGGLLMGAVLNLAPELYRACLAVVPFVDALTTILDPELPLSALEWEEWGNPIEDAAVYEAMRAYTPYENVRAVDYPAIAAVTSLNDTRVHYVEPAKWVAQLRRTVTSDQATRPAGSTRKVPRRAIPRSSSRTP